ncbi:hypothetical protein VU04_00865 [Desulfobulbus sp. TB]|nr:hypothetical protein [Desulfobulbus sp. TB]
MARRRCSLSGPEMVSGLLADASCGTNAVPKGRCKHSPLLQRRAEAHDDNEEFDE